MIIHVWIGCFATVTVLGKYNLAGKVTSLFDVHILLRQMELSMRLWPFCYWSRIVYSEEEEFYSTKQIMMFAMILSIPFLVSYICHHLFAGETMYRETDGIKGLSGCRAGSRWQSMRTVYLAIPITHIPLAGIALLFILFAYIGPWSENMKKHKKLVRIIWPIWFYVAITGVLFI